MDAIQLMREWFPAWSDEERHDVLWNCTAYPCGGPVVRHRAEAQVPDGPLQPFALAMPEEYVPRLCPNPAQSFVEAVCVAAYRDYYRAEKRGYWRKSRDPAKPSTWIPAKWTKRDPPEWF